MRKDRYLAINIRRQGKSYNEISRELGIPKSTLHSWFKDNQWSIDIKASLIKKSQVLAVPKLKLMALANKKKWEALHEEFRQEAIKEFVDLKEDKLFLTGLMLYWGEGDKVIKNGKVRLANSDPEMIKIFYLFLIRVLKIPRERIIIKLTLYPDLKDIKYRKYWSKILNIPITQFRTSSVIIGKHPTRRLSYGVCSIEVYSRKLKEKIFTWIRMYQQRFNKIYSSMV